MQNSFKPTILFVEDEEAIRNQLGRFLKRFCKELFLAQNGLEGLELYKKNQPDIIISDIKMPKMDGLAMLKEIKNINKEQIVIFTSAHSDSEYFIESIDLNVDGYILKPVNLKILESKIKQISSQIFIQREYQKQLIILNEISTHQKNLLVVLDENEKSVFMNNKALEIFQVSNYIEFNEKYESIYSTFDKVENIAEINRIKVLKNNEKIVSIIDKKDLVAKSYKLSSKYLENTKHMLLSFADVTDMVMNEQKLKEKAFTDELTNIYNRAYFNQEIENRIKLSKNQNEIFSLTILDIDHFKNLNDTYGHQTGDMILKNLSKLIKEHTRSSDTFARWGGEEFVIIFKDSNLSNAKQSAENLRRLIENKLFEKDLKITCSFGITEFTKNDDAETILKRADKALYIAKEDGRNRVYSL